MNDRPKLDPVEEDVALDADPDHDDDVALDPEGTPPPPENPRSR